MPENYQIDKVDRQILQCLLDDARTPYLEIARKLLVSGGTVHQRMAKMTELGLVTGSTLTLDRRKLGLDVTVLIGIHMKSAKNLNNLISKLDSWPEVIEAYYTTGNFALMIKVCVESIQSYHEFLSRKLQSIDSVQSTESFICLDQPISREISVKE